MYKFKKIILLLLIIVIIGVVLYLNLKNNKSENIQKEIVSEIVPENEIRSLCYFRSNSYNNIYYDKAWLILNINENKINGEFQNLPAESDSKIGRFEGTVGPLERESMGRTANVWWEAEAEGTKVKEELIIKFGDGSATVGFGEMIDRGDGIYIYKNNNNLFFIESMNQIDCEQLDEKLFIEKYLRENINKVSEEKPVLGGTWYVISSNIIPGIKTGEVVYEDGHIQIKTKFTYEFNKNTKELKFTNFETIK